MQFFRNMLDRVPAGSYNDHVVTVLVLFAAYSLPFILEMRFQLFFTLPFRFARGPLARLQKM